jgi:sugar/nucleoside kinase (ribokinase family)
MSLVVVGSVAFDNVQTPLEKRENLIGGSATHFACAAAFFTQVNLVGVVGNDWPEEHTKLLQSKGIDTKGLAVEPDAKTFTWTGKYLENMNDRETLDVQLNAFATFNPILPESYVDCNYLFLANGAPSIQMKVLDQCSGPKLVVADTMDFYINSARDELLELLKKIDGLVLNDGEAKLLTGDSNLVYAGRTICKMGPRFVIIKKGEHGAMFMSEHETYVLPAYPTPDVEDPTGAGDSFAGGMMGYLAREGNVEPNTLKKAMAYGTLTASFNVEGFSFDRLSQITLTDIDRRMEEYQKMLRFD